jgi:hypothetical protein
LAASFLIASRGIAESKAARVESAEDRSEVKKKSKAAAEVSELFFESRSAARTWQLAEMARSWLTKTK